MIESAKAPRPHPVQVPAKARDRDRPDNNKRANQWPQSTKAFSSRLRTSQPRAFHLTFKQSRTAVTKTKTRAAEGARQWRPSSLSWWTSATSSADSTSCPWRFRGINEVTSRRLRKETTIKQMSWIRRSPWPFDSKHFGSNNQNHRKPKSSRKSRNWIAKSQIKVTHRLSRWWCRGLEKRQRNPTLPI